MSKQIGRVLVTGGAGFIGCALSQQLAGDARSWVVFDNLHPQVHPSRDRPALLHDAAELVVGDVTRAADWAHVLSNGTPDIIVHLAAETGTAQSLHEATRHAEVNVVGTARMLDALGRAGHTPEHFVLSGSRAVYGEGEWRRGDGTLLHPGQRTHAQFEAAQWDFPDAAPVRSEASRTWAAPTSIYGATKLAQEHLLSAWAGAHDVPLSILRFQNAYGPGQSRINSHTGIVSLFSQWAMKSTAIPVYEDGRITRDFVFIDDVAASIAAVVAQRPAPGAITRHDVGSGVGTTILELARLIASLNDAPEPTISGQYRDGDVRHAECDISRTTADLAWRPVVDLKTGIARLQEWIAAHQSP